MSAAETIARLREPFVPAARILAGEENDIAVKTWNTRQGMLSAIEANGTFYDGVATSPKQAELFDTCEESFRFARAESLAGILAKLWVALAHLGPPPAECGNAERAGYIRAEHDSVRRADSDEVSSFIGDWDFGEEVLFGAIRDLERMVGEA